jgi:hypothetical protein
MAMKTSLAEKRTVRTPGRIMLRLLVVLVLAACMDGVSPTVSALAQSQPDFSGNWSGGEWGEVVLERIGPVSYAGTYSSTYGKHTGRVAFSYVAGNFEGKWWEGTARLGTVTLQPSEDGRVLTGTYSTSPASTIKPGEPKSASLKWVKK